MNLALTISVQGRLVSNSLWTIRYSSIHANNRIRRLSSNFNQLRFFERMRPSKRLRIHEI